MVSDSASEGGADSMGVNSLAVLAASVSPAVPVVPSAQLSTSWNVSVFSCDMACTTLGGQCSGACN